MIKPYYEDEWVTIYNGDCREILPGLCSFDLGITSPPYNLYKKWWDSGISELRSHKELMRKFTETWYPDQLPEDKYQERERELLRIAASLCRGSLCYNHKVRYAFKRAGASFHPMLWLSEFPLWVEIIWDKGAGVAINSRRPCPSDERIFVLSRPKAWHNLKWSTIWRIAPDNEAPGHPCAFPLKIPQRLINMFTDPGDIVVDWYMGSGTTLVAAKQLGRKSIGIEIEKKYCEIAVKRLAQSVMNLEAASQKEEVEQKKFSLLEA